MSQSPRLIWSRSGPPVLVVMTVLIWATVPADAWAVRVNGSASVWAYTREDSVNHVQVVPVLSFTLGELHDRDLRFEASLRGYTDVRCSKSEDRELRLLRGVFIYTPSAKPYELRLGQQWLSEGVGRGNLTGVWGRYRIDARTSVTAYAGARLQNSLSLQNRNDEPGTAAGIHIRTRLDPVNVGASYYYVHKDGKLLYHAAGLEAQSRILRTLSARGRFEMNVEQGVVERAQIMTDWQARTDLLVTAEFRSQAPRLFEDSYFTRFLSEASTEFARASARWVFYRDFYARGGGTILFTEEPDPLYKAQVTFGWRKNIEIGYTHWLSVSSAVMNGLFAQASYRFHDKAEAFGGVDWSRGSDPEGDLKPKTDTHAAHFGGSVTPILPLTVTARAEQIGDLVHSSDWRGLAALTVRFASR
jgi:hypothetical protein